MTCRVTAQKNTNARPHFVDPDWKNLIKPQEKIFFWQYSVHLFASIWTSWISCYWLFHDQRWTCRNIMLYQSTSHKKLLLLTVTSSSQYADSITRDKYCVGNDNLKKEWISGFFELSLTHREHWIASPRNLSLSASSADDDRLSLYTWRWALNFFGH